MNMSVKAGAVFTYFNSVAGTAAYFTWIIIMLTFLRVRAGLAAQGVDLKTLPFKAVGSIWIYRLTTLFFVFLLFIQGWTVFKHPFNWRLFIASYITIPTFIALFFGYKWYHGTRWWVFSSHCSPLHKPHPFWTHTSFATILPVCAC